MIRERVTEGRKDEEKREIQFLGDKRRGNRRRYKAEERDTVYEEEEEKVKHSVWVCR